MASSTAIIDNGVARLKQCRYGLMLYLSADQYIGQSLDRYGEFSEGEAHLFRHFVKPGQTVVDVGANVGVHAVVFARQVGPEGIVVALEPQRMVFQMLCANAALNNLQNVIARHAAAGRTAGETKLPPIDYTAGFNFGGLSVAPGYAGETVSVVAIDDLQLRECHFIKVDVEGAELDVLAGAEKTIARCRPVLYVENDRREKSANLIHWILDRQYRLYWHLPRLFNSDNFFGDQENIFGSAISANMLCIRAEAPQNISGMREITSPDDYWR